MSNTSKIEWTEATWNPVVGCTRVSPGCDRCYAVRQSYRLERMGQAKYAGLTVLNPRGERHFNGVVRCDEEALTVPLGWRKPRRIFVNSMSDLFHREVPLPFIVRCFAVMALCPQHVFQVLTKRPERMIVMGEDHIVAAVFGAADELSDSRPGTALEWHVRKVCAANGSPMRWPLPNVHLGTSVEDQAAADERIPHLLRCPARVRFLSCEPLLGALELSRWLRSGADGLESRHGGICDTENISAGNLRPHSSRGATCCDAAPTRRTSDSQDMAAVASMSARDGTSSHRFLRTWDGSQAQSTPSNESTMTETMSQATADGHCEPSNQRTSPTPSALPRSATRGRSLSGSEKPASVEERSSAGSIADLRQRSPCGNDLHWVIVGGESGGGARPCDVAWIRSIVTQCRAAMVPCFVKQLGAVARVDYYERDDDLREWALGRPHTVWNPDGMGVVGGVEAVCKWSAADGQPRPGAVIDVAMGKKGGTMLEWPCDLRVREWPDQQPRGGEEIDHV